MSKKANKQPAVLSQCSTSISWRLILPLVTLMTNYLLGRVCEEEKQQANYCCGTQEAVCVIISSVIRLQWNSSVCLCADGVNKGIFALQPDGR